MTEEEKQRHLACVRTGAAFGGKEVSPWMEQEIRGVLDGKHTYDDVICKIKKKYKRPV